MISYFQAIVIGVLQGVTELVPISTDRPARKPGFAKGVLTIVADDEEHLEDFKDYMP